MTLRIFLSYILLIPARSFTPLYHRSEVSRNTVLSVATAGIPPQKSVVDAISETNPVKVLIAGAGVGGLAVANVLSKNPNIDVTVIERTDEFKRFGGPIQLASNALQVIKEMDEDVFDQIMEEFTFTGDKTNGIKDGIRNEWYAEFDLESPAKDRNLPYTGVIDRPDLQEIYLNSLPPGVVKNGDGIATYSQDAETGQVTVTLDSGAKMTGDVLIGADGIWSAVRATMRNQPIRGEGSGAKYSGYTVFAGELDYDSPDNGKVGYKVYIGPGQYFVVTDIGKGRYQWYAFLARPPGSVDSYKPEGSSKYLQDVFKGWSSEIFDILKVTKEHEIEQRDLYDRPPSVGKPWTDGHVALLGDGIHAMMPNLGQGGCQAIEDAYVIADELSKATRRRQISNRLKKYRDRRIIRTAAVQGLSRFASDIIIRGFDTPTKFIWKEGNGPRIENFNYAGIVTRVLQPILPLFFTIQFNFLYDGFKNKNANDVVTTFILLTAGGLTFLISAGVAEKTGLVG